MKRKYNKILFIVMLLIISIGRVNAEENLTRITTINPGTGEESDYIIRNDEPNTIKFGFENAEETVAKYENGEWKVVTNTNNNAVVKEVKFDYTVVINEDGYIDFDDLPKNIEFIYDKEDMYIEKVIFLNEYGDEGRSVLYGDEFITNDTQTTDDCGIYAGEVLDLIQEVFNYIKIIVPILIIVLSSFDFGKAILADDDKDIKKAASFLYKRLIIAAVIFLLPFLIEGMFSLAKNIWGSDWLIDGICGIK